MSNGKIMRRSRTRPPARRSDVIRFPGGEMTVGFVPIFVNMFRRQVAESGRVSRGDPNARILMTLIDRGYICPNVAREVIDPARTPSPAT